MATVRPGHGASAQELSRRLWEADSIAVLFGTMSTGKLSQEEETELGRAQASAIDDWLAAYVAFKTNFPDECPAFDQQPSTISSGLRTPG